MFFISHNFKHPDYPTGIVVDFRITMVGDMYDYSAVFPFKTIGENRRILMTAMLSDKQCVKVLVDYMKRDSYNAYKEIKDCPSFVRDLMKSIQKKLENLLNKWKEIKDLSEIFTDEEAKFMSHSTKLWDQEIRKDGPIECVIHDDYPIRKLKANRDACGGKNGSFTSSQY